MIAAMAGLLLLCETLASPARRSNKTVTTTIVTATAAAAGTAAIDVAGAEAEATSGTATIVTEPVDAVMTIATLGECGITATTRIVAEVAIGGWAVMTTIGTTAAEAEAARIATVIGDAAEAEAAAETGGVMTITTAGMAVAVMMIAIDVTATIGVMKKIDGVAALHRHRPRLLQLRLHISALRPPLLAVAAAVVWTASPMLTPSDGRSWPRNGTKRLPPGRTTRSDPSASRAR